MRENHSPVPSRSDEVQTAVYPSVWYGPLAGNTDLLVEVTLKLVVDVL